MVAEQARLFAAMALCGAAMGAAYDAAAAMHALLGGGRALRAALDMAFGLCFACAMIAAGLRLRADPFRLYAFAGAAAGFAVYMTTLGAIVRILKRKMESFVKKS